eukprot:TRINITY_DN13704_c0_g1_i1.p1 TRINITY_DN13704_c0_g1~~TRINITY_DN13704_c0_g1_i1.p1  ORF type:complete len:148 (+),score=28.21 TRINITY_DN13704_c0_g1_i1:32-445(+)
MAPTCSHYLALLITTFIMCQSGASASKLDSVSQQFSPQRQQPTISQVIYDTTNKMDSEGDGDGDVDGSPTNACSNSGALGYGGGIALGFVLGIAIGVGGTYAYNRFRESQEMKKRLPQVWSMDDFPAQRLHDLTEDP